MLWGIGSVTTLLLCGSVSRALPAPSSVTQQVFQLVPKDLLLLSALEDASISDLTKGLDSGSFTSVDLTKAYFERIQLFSDVNAVISLNKQAVAAAANADFLRQSLETLPANLSLLGIPFLVKDNLAIPPELGPTTAGSYALMNSTVIAASPVVQRLLDAGAILLGTTNMDEFAQAKGDHPWGWSARGGQMRSIYGASSNDTALRKGFGDICGSSGGSALSVALGLAAFALGTQTGVSIVCPAGRAGIVGFKPGHGGMTPMRGVLPISKHLDVVGPLGRTVEDVALVWRAIKHPAGWNETVSDEFRGIGQPQSYLPAASTKPYRVGIPRKGFWDRLTEDGMPFIESSISDLVTCLNSDERFQIVEKDILNITSLTANTTFHLSRIITSHELKMGINRYLQNWTLDTPNSVRSLGDIIQYNIQHAAVELPEGPFPAFGHPPDPVESYGDQSFLIESNSINVSGPENDTYVEAMAEMERLTWTEGLEQYYQGENAVDVMMVPTDGYAGTIASLSRSPQITLPLGFLPPDFPLEANATWPIFPYPDMPFGVSLLASRGHESHFQLLAIAAELETILKAGRRRERMRTNIRSRL